MTSTSKYLSANILLELLRINQSPRALLMITMMVQLSVGKTNPLSNRTCKFINDIVKLVVDVSRSLQRPSGDDAWLPSLHSQFRDSAGSPAELTMSLYKCVALLRAVYGPSTTVRTLGSIREVSRFWVSIS